MIDWQQTLEIFGYGIEILSTKRPNVVCSCDRCNKNKNVKVRDKSRLFDNQMNWLCHSCVKLNESKAISDRMKLMWKQEEYQSRQSAIKNSESYKRTQSQLSKERWKKEEYKQKLTVGINRDDYIARSNEQYGNSFDYSITKFEGWHDRVNIICNNCGKELNKDPQKHLEHGFCQYCGVTKGQKQIYDYINSLGYFPLVNDRSTIDNLELDIHLPSHNLAIEYNGIYWHSYNKLETKEQRNKHQNKALRCIEKGITLLQFFDFEWKNKRHIVESMVANSLQKSSKLNARDLDITELKNDESKYFFQNNHLLGHRTASITLALTKDKEIHCALSFSKIHGGYEIIRMATKAGESIRGGASKILNHFQNSHSGTLYTYADLRYSSGKAYKRLGFEQIKITPPGYFYTTQRSRDYHILSRQQCQKNKLHNLLPEFNVDLSESQNMFNNGFRRVWTAGNILFSKKL